MSWLGVPDLLFVPRVLLLSLLPGQADSTPPAGDQTTKVTFLRDRFPRSSRGAFQGLGGGFWSVFWGRPGALFAASDKGFMQ